MSSIRGCYLHSTQINLVVQQNAAFFMAWRVHLLMLLPTFLNVCCRENGKYVRRSLPINRTEPNKIFYNLHSNPSSYMGSSISLLPTEGLLNTVFQLFPFNALRGLPILIFTLSYKACRITQVKPTGLPTIGSHLLAIVGKSKHKMQQYLVVERISLLRLFGIQTPNPIATLYRNDTFNAYIYVIQSPVAIYLKPKSST